MNLVARMFVGLNELLLFVCAIAVPVIVGIAAFVEPSLVTESYSLDGETIFMLLLWLLGWELFVVVSFGFISIVIQNHKNLALIAEHLTDGETRKDIPLSGNRSEIKADPTLRG